MDDTSLQRKLIQMENEVRNLKIAHERGLGVVQMWVKYVSADIRPNTQAYLNIVPVDSTNFFANASSDSTVGLTILPNGTWRFNISSTIGLFSIWVQANNQFTWSVEAV